MDAIASSPSAPPDWSAVADEILCPLCDYNLRGLAEPRCPECGFRFAWPELLDPGLRKHPFLFEHHPERNLWSLRRTLLAGFRPLRFWSSLHPMHPIRARRLLIYALWPVLVCLLSPAGLLLNDAQMVQRNARQTRLWLAATLKSPAGLQKWQTYMRRQGNATTQALIDAVAPVPTLPVGAIQAARMPGSAYVWRTLAPLAWPPLTLASLLVFQVSMAKARINTRHVLRCVVYSFDVIVWMMLPIASLAWAVPAVVGAYPWAAPLIPAATATWIIGLGLLAVVRLWAAYALYLRFDRPFATILASQVITVLAMLVLATSPAWFR